jgi:hypothetical protein
MPRIFLGLTSREGNAPCPLFHVISSVTKSRAEGHIPLLCVTLIGLG